MGNALGLAAFALYITCVIGMAAAVTWIVVKVSPTPEDRRARREQQDQT
jgi:hypothetical protein